MEREIKNKAASIRARLGLIGGLIGTDTYFL